MANTRAARREMIPGRRVTFALAFIVGLSLLLGCATFRPSGQKPVRNATAEAAGKLHQCAACHGGDGVSTAEIFPNLAGQHPEYIVEQLTAFRQRTRKDREAKSYMWGVGKGLSDPTIAALALDYAAMPRAPAAARGRPAEFAAGQAIFQKGVPDHGVAACVTCHGAHAEGTAAFPALAGQHKDYVAIQLAAFASGSRDNAVMHVIAKGLTRQEMKDVADYLSSQ